MMRNALFFSHSFSFSHFCTFFPVCGPNMKYAKIQTESTGFSDNDKKGNTMFFFKKKTTTLYVK